MTLRYKLILAALPIKDIKKTPTGWQFTMELPGLGHLISHAPPEADLRDGDRLTLYTEVLVKRPVKDVKKIDVGG